MEKQFAKENAYLPTVSVSRVLGCLFFISLILPIACSRTIKLNYRSNGADQVASGQVRSTQRVSLVDIIDLKGKLEEKHLGRLRVSIRDHAKSSGFSDENTWYAPAPQNPEELNRLLDEASKRGSDLVLFLRLGSVYAVDGAAKAVSIVSALGPLSGVLPDVIVYSLPINTEHAEISVRAYLVDATTKNLLYTFEERSVLLDKRTTAWGLNAKRELKGLMYETMQKVFEKTAHTIEAGEFTDNSDTSVSALLFNPITM